MRFLLIALAGALTACSASPPYRIVYSSGFSFANYDYLVITKPSGEGSTYLFGMDVELASVFNRYGIKVIGDSEKLKFTQDQLKRTLLARGEMTSSRKQILLSVSFDDAVTDLAEANITAQVKGDVFNPDARDRAYASITNAITTALEQEKGLTIKDVPQPK